MGESSESESKPLKRLTTVARVRLCGACEIPGRAISSTMGSFLACGIVRRGAGSVGDDLLDIL